MKEFETATDIEQKVKELGQIAERGFNKLVSEIKQGNTEKYLEYLTFMSKFHRYSSFNQMLIYCQKPDATLVAGYRKWQEMGYLVKRGEQGIKILAPVFAKRREENAYGQLVSLEKLVGYKEVKVFDTSQLAVPVKGYWDYRQKLPNNAEEKYQLVIKAVEADTHDVIDRPMKSQQENKFSFDTIVINSDLEPVERMILLIHKWADEILYKGGRSSELGIVPDTVKQCQIDSIAYILSGYLDINFVFNKENFLHHCNTAEILVRNMQVIQKTTQFMIGKIQEGVLAIQ